MKSMIDVEYGCDIKPVQLPVQYSPAGFEECLQNVFHFKGKNVFGLRLSNTSDIIVLDDLTNEKPLLEEAEKWCNPYTILFHNSLSDYRRKEIRLDKQEFNKFLDAIHCEDPMTQESFSSFVRYCFHTSNINQVASLLDISIENEISRDSLFNAFIHSVEKPLSQRLKMYFSLVHCNCRGLMDEQNIQSIFRLLYWQEVCCYGTGMFISSIHPLIYKKAQLIAEQFIIDNQIMDYSLDFSHLLCWLMYCSDSFFPSSFYTNPQQFLPNLSNILTIEERTAVIDTPIEDTSIEAIYLLYSLYSSISQYHPPLGYIDDILSGYITSENTISNSDLLDCLYKYFQLVDDENENMIIKLHQFYDLIIDLFNDTDSDYLLCDIVFIIFAILSFLSSNDIDDSSSWLIDLLCTDENGKYITSDSVYCYISTFVRLFTLVTIPPCSCEDSSYLINNDKQVYEEQDKQINFLFRQVLDFTALSNIQQESLKQQFSTSGTPVEFFYIVIQYSFLPFYQHWNSQQTFSYLTTLYQTKGIDHFLTVKPAIEKENVVEPSAKPFDTVSFCETVRMNEKEHMTLFSSSNLGLLYTYMIIYWREELHLQELTCSTLLHVFSTYDHYDGSTDNMYFSEYSSFIHSILQAIHSDQITLHPFFSSLFYHLSRSSSLRINRYELLLCLSFFIKDFYQPHNLSSLWLLLQATNSIPDQLSSFTLFAQAIVSLTNLFFPHLLSNIHKSSQQVIDEIRKAYWKDCLTFHNYQERSFITEIDFLQWAPTACSLDLLILQGNGLLNNHIETILSLFSVHDISYHDFITVFSTLSSESIPTPYFIEFFNSNFPLPPFSSEMKERMNLLHAYCSLFEDENQQMNLLAVKASFSSIMIENRQDLWNEVIHIISNDSLTKEVFITTLEAMIRMSLWILTDNFPLQVLDVIRSYLYHIIPTTYPLSSETCLDFFYSHIQLLLPSSYVPSLLSRPIIAYNNIMNLRYVAGLSDVLFSHVCSIMKNCSVKPILSKGEYYEFIRAIVSSKPLKITYVNEVYSRILKVANSIHSTVQGISKRSLLFLLSSLYPNNSSLISTIYSLLEENSTISFNNLLLYLLHVYSLLNEFFECFDLTLISIYQVAVNVTKQCFSSYHLSLTDSLSSQQFTQWMVNSGPYDISRINTTISHFPPINHFRYEVSYDLLSTSLSLYLFDPKRIYSINDLQQVDFQICSDKLVSYAKNMNYSKFTPEMKEIIKQQQDPQGNVARSSFIASLSKLILEQYVENENEERELLLQTSTRVQNEENELKPIREGLAHIFNCLDIMNSQLVPINQLISLLCLLSYESIDIRLKRMISESCTIIDGAAYLHEVDLIMYAFYLFFDILMPEIDNSNQTTPLVETSSLYKKLRSYSDMNMIEVATIVQVLHQELVIKTYQLKNITANRKENSISIKNYLSSFNLSLSSASKYLLPFLVQEVNEKEECCFIIEEFVKRKKLRNGLLHLEMNRVLCRDFIRRMFSLWKILFPPSLLENFMSLLFQLFGKNYSIQFDHIFRVIMLFVSLPQNSVTKMASLYYTVIETIANQHVTVKDIEECIQILVRMWLVIVSKESLLSKQQVHSLVLELVKKEEGHEDDMISMNGFVGNCVIQALNPSSMNMQRLIACLFHSCMDSVRTIWEGEMPECV